MSQGEDFCNHRRQNVDPDQFRKAQPIVAEAVKERLREQYRTLDPVTLLAEIRSAHKDTPASTVMPEACS
jgi:hypothetical protein